MRKSGLTSFNAIRDVVRPESNIVQKHLILVCNGLPYKEYIKVYSPDIDMFYNFAVTMDVHMFKNKSANQWNISEWITPEELKS